jgi:hypothetical protein
MNSTFRKWTESLTAGVAYSQRHCIDDSSDRTDTFVNSLDLRSNKARSNFDLGRCLVIVSLVISKNFGSCLDDSGRTQ